MKTRLIRAMRSSLIFIIPGIVLLIRDHAAGAYLLAGGIAEIILGTIIPAVAIFIEFIAGKVIEYLKLIVNILITGLLQIIIFTIIRFIGAVFGKYFLDKSPRLKDDSYYKSKDNDWKERIEEPF
ncbi:MAG: hypothetical protein SVK54_01030 [candidate division WOR-3 bacterium]|nr:hypothetical protein [candidate division WOR-3 bacterium]